MRRGGERETSLMMGWVRGAHKLGSESKSAIEAGEQRKRESIVVQKTCFTHDEAMERRAAVGPRRGEGNLCPFFGRGQLGPWRLKVLLWGRRWLRPFCFGASVFDCCCGSSFSD